MRQVLFRRPTNCALRYEPHKGNNARRGALLLILELAVFIYTWGVYQVWRRAGAGRGLSFRHCGSFFGAILALFVALTSPLEALSGALFSAHMLQHLLLILVAAPLLVMSDFPLAVMWALPRRSAQAVGRIWNRAQVMHRAWLLIKSPLVVWLLFAITIWVWHTPILYELAVHSPAIHVVEHLAFLLAAMLFWWILIDTSRPNHIRYGIAVPYLFTTTLHSSILGALMLFTSQPWYPIYMKSATALGLSPLHDQQLAGLIMWLPGGAVFTLLAVLSFGAWLHTLEKRAA